MLERSERFQSAIGIYETTGVNEVTSARSRRSHPSLHPSHPKLTPTDITVAIRVYLYVLLVLQVSPKLPAYDRGTEGTVVGKRAQDDEKHYLTGLRSC